MEQIALDHLQETLYFEKLPNGLSVYLLPKPEFSKTYAMFSTRYGSIDNHFQTPGKEASRVPDGIAHFLEHKMFEKEEGDVFQIFGRQGASANAFTSFDRTSYLVSCTEHVEENLMTLIDFVQEPYFTDQTVEKEKGIIAQEIRMYDDNPDWRSYFGLIEAMYHKHPVKIDIAGTVESIQKINKDLLYHCYYTFYHPSNMILFVIGSFDPQKIMERIRENQAKTSFQEQREIKRFFPEEPEEVAEELRETRLSVGTPKIMFGFKENHLGKNGEELCRQILTTQLVLEALFGTGSDFYQSLYDEGLIDNSFITEYTLDKTYGFSLMGGDTPDPDRLLQRVKEEVPAMIQQGISSEVFQRVHRKKIGQTVRQFNSLEWIANQFTRYRFHDFDLFQILPLLEQITVDELNQRLQEHLGWDRFAASIVRPL